MEAWIRHIGAVGCGQFNQPLPTTVDELATGRVAPRWAQLACRVGRDETPSNRGVRPVDGCCDHGLKPFPYLCNLQARQRTLVQPLAWTLADLTGRDRPRRCRGRARARPAHLVGAAGACGVRAPEEDRFARLALACLAEPNDVALHHAVAAHGAETVLSDLRAGRGGLPGRAAYQVRLPLVDIAVQLRACRRGRRRYVVPGDLEWPSCELDRLRRPASPGQKASVPPLGLWLRGPLHLRGAALRSVSLVGSRAATSYGVRVASEIASRAGGP